MGASAKSRTSLTDKPEMRNYLSFVRRALWFTAGLILSLLALAKLAAFITSGAYFEDWAENGLPAFVLLAAIGIPTLLYGIATIGRDEAES